MKSNLQDIRKEQIMNAAQAVVVNKGYDQSRMDDIVKKAKLSKKVKKIKASISAKS